MDLLTLLQNEQQRVAEALPSMKPGTEEYARTFELLRTMRWEINEMLHPVPFGETPPPTFTPVPKYEGPEQSDSGEEETGPTPPAFDVEEYRTVLRARMSDARLKGADTKAWLAEVGATKFSTITDPCKLMKLSELVGEFEKENK